MCKAIEDMRNEAAKQAAWQRSVENATKMLIRGKLTVEEIAEDSGLTLEEVQELAKEVQKPV